MIFPPYLVPFLGNGMVIGLNAVIHVIISHGIAIGAIAMMALGESRFGGRGPEGVRYPGWQEFNKGFLRFNVFTITILGAVTGAGIWFTVMALASLGQTHMIRVFFWIWFFEYFVFFAEIIVLLILYFRWDELRANSSRYLAGLAALYAALAITSGISITSILGFMLTPGAWLKTGRLWDAVLNPSFPPQTAARLSFAFVIGSLVALSRAAFMGSVPFQGPALRLFGKVLLISTIAFFASLVVYLYAVPRAFTSHIPFAVLTSHFSRYPVIFSGFNTLFFLTLLACAAAAMTGRLRTVRLLALPAAISIVVLVVQFERVREFIRGPYLMPGHMYANSVLLDEEPLLKARGLAAVSPWFTEIYPRDEINRGAFVFAQNCAICHTVGGLNDIHDRLKGRSYDGIYVILGNIHRMVPFMPPFSGSEEERKSLTGFLDRVRKGEVRFKSRTRAIVEGAP